MSERQFHIQCTAEDIGKYVFLPGDPGRTEWIASYLEHPVKTAQNREFTTWTGTLDGTKVSVTSTGIGIPLQAQSRIFERFYRVDKSRSKQRGGTGLGLSIVKHIVDCHNGTISLRSELGHGTEITLLLPEK